MQARIVKLKVSKHGFCIENTESLKAERVRSRIVIAAMSVLAGISKHGFYRFRVLALHNRHVLLEILLEPWSSFPVRPSDNPVHHNREIGKHLQEVFLGITHQIECFGLWQWTLSVLPV